MKQAEATIAGIGIEDLQAIKQELNGRIVSHEITIPVGSEIVRAYVAYEDPERVGEPGKLTGGTIIAPGVSEEVIRGYAITQGKKNRMTFGPTALGKKMGVDVAINDLDARQEWQLLRGLLDGMYELGIPLGNGNGLHRIGPDRNCTQRRMDLITSAVAEAYGLDEESARSSVTGKSPGRGGHLGRPQSTGRVAAAGLDRVLTEFGVSPEEQIRGYTIGFGEASYPYLSRLRELRPGYQTNLLRDHTAMVHFPEGLEAPEALWELVHEGELNSGFAGLDVKQLKDIGGKFVTSSALSKNSGKLSETLRNIQILTPAARDGLVSLELLHSMQSLAIVCSIANRPYTNTEVLRRYEGQGGVDLRDYVINSGGIRITDQEASHPFGVTAEVADEHVEAEERIVALQIADIFKTAREYGVPFGVAADGLSLATDIQSIK